MGTFVQNVHKYSFHIYLKHKCAVFTVSIALGLLSVVLFFILTEKNQTFFNSEKSYANANHRRNLNGSSHSGNEKTFNETFETINNLTITKKDLNLTKTVHSNVTDTARTLFPTKLGTIFNHISALRVINNNAVSNFTFKTYEHYKNDLRLILTGINKIENIIGSSPGVLSVYGTNAFPILSGASTLSFLRPIVGAGYHEKGRFVAYSHADCFIDFSKSNHLNERLFGKVAKWVSGEKKNINAALCVFPYDISKFTRVLSENGISSQVLPYSNKELANVTILKKYDLIVFNNFRGVNEEEVEIIRQYVASGGGIIVGATPQFITSVEIPRSSCLQEYFWGNRILKPLGGISFIGGFTYGYETTYGAFNTSQLYLQDTHAAQVWMDMKTVIRTKHVVPHRKIEQMKNILQDQIQYAPKDINLFYEMTSLLVELITPSNSIAQIDQLVENFTFTPENVWINVKKVLEEKMVIPKDKIAKVNSILREQVSSISSCSVASLALNIVSEFAKIMHYDAL